MQDFVEFVNTLPSFKSIVKAVFIKEVKVRFFYKGYLSYFWIIGDTIIPLLVLLFIWGGIRGMTTRMGVPVEIAIISGWLPYHFFAKTITSNVNIIDANEALLSFKQVKIFSILVARTLLEGFITLCAFIILYLVFLYLGVGQMVYNYLLLTGGLVILVMFSIGVSLIASVVTFYFMELRVLIASILRVLMLVSGVVFPIEIIPQPYRSYLYYNPILQVISFIRSSFVQYEIPDKSSGLDLNYLILCTLLSLILGLIFYRFTEKSFITKARSRV